MLEYLYTLNPHMFMGGRSKNPKYWAISRKPTEENKFFLSRILRDYT